MVARWPRRSADAIAAMGYGFYVAFERGLLPSLREPPMGFR